jgi:hypothetical protein
MTPSHRSQTSASTSSASCFAKHFRNRLLLSETTIFKSTLIQLLVGMERQEQLLGAAKISRS